MQEHYNDSDNLFLIAPIVNSGCIVLFNKLFAKKEPMVDTISTIGSLFFSRKALYVEGFFFLQ